MTYQPYSIVILRYVHDPTTGEGLNVGVVLYQSQTAHLEYRLLKKYERLSNAFRNFQPDTYRRLLISLEAALDGEAQDRQRALIVERRETDAAHLVRAAWPIADGVFALSEVRKGITSDLVVEADAAFLRFVESVAPNKARDGERRDDTAIWRSVFMPRLPPPVVHALKPKTFETNALEVKFDYAYKNAQWHVIEPASFDYVRAQSMQEKAQRLVGISVALEDVTEFGTIHFLIGEPTEPTHRQSFDRALNLLHKVPVRHEFIRETEAAQFGQKLAMEMVEHGVIDHDEGALA